MTEGGDTMATGNGIATTGTGECMMLQGTGTSAYVPPLDFEQQACKATAAESFKLWVPTYSDMVTMTTDKDCPLAHLHSLDISCIHMSILCGLGGEHLSAENVESRLATVELSGADQAMLSCIFEDETLVECEQRNDGNNPSVTVLGATAGHECNININIPSVENGTEATGTQGNESGCGCGGL